MNVHWPKVTVGTKELKDHLTKYLRLVRAGQSIIVTVRGKPVAELRPVGDALAVASVEARLAALAARGLVTLPRRSRFEPFRPVAVRGEPVSATILRDRR